ncbi:hypothetical protein Poli38472_003943 [Pythium oligandrum]|uniref:Uncharacterized protein n=1 Tax=Pythium oligandrum TaxID=41045 RepID=A0A8K1FQ20_PYTOL|nr:hypothetical protein Poli38472_003943 [Pythium oligandrum]|eukprot:TMW66178.1 hypothetical protein Poli38472_003943 [Pythium oligandrum]
MENEELGSMPPLPRPQKHPSVQTAVDLRQVARANRMAAQRRPHRIYEDEEMMTMQAPPKPHAHPLQGWKGNSRPATGRDGRRSSVDMVIALGRPTVRSRRVEVQRLDPTFLNQNRIAAFVDKENFSTVTNRRTEDHGSAMLHSTRVLEKQIERITTAEVTKVTELDDDAMRFAATEASDYRHALGFADENGVQEGASMDPYEDTALNRARVRKVKKQVDPKWLQTRQDPTLRPLRPLERPNERHFYESRYEVTISDLLESGIVFDEKDRKGLREMTPLTDSFLMTPLETRGTTGLYGCCFDEWAFA